MNYYYCVLSCMASTSPEAMMRLISLCTSQLVVVQGVQDYFSGNRLYSIRERQNLYNTSATFICTFSVVRVIAGDLARRARPEA